MKLFAKFGAIFVTSQSVVLSLCKIKRLNSNSFVLRLRYLQILFPPWFPLFQQPILCCVPLLGFMVSAPRFKIQSYCPLFSLCWGRIRFTNHKKNQLSNINNNVQKGRVFFLHFGPKIPFVLQKYWKWKSGMKWKWRNMSTLSLLWHSNWCFCQVREVIAL